MSKNKVEANTPSSFPFEAGALLDWSEGSARNFYMVVQTGTGPSRWINLHTGVVIEALTRGTAKAIPSVTITAQK